MAQLNDFHQLVSIKPRCHSFSIRNKRRVYSLPSSLSSLVHSCVYSVCTHVHDSVYILLHILIHCNHICIRMCMRVCLNVYGEMDDDVPCSEMNKVM